MAKSKLVEMNKKIEKTVVEGYKKVEDGAVGGFNKIADKFVDSFLTKDGESVEEAKERMAREQEALTQKQEDIVKESMNAAEDAARDARRKAGLE